MGLPDSTRLFVWDIVSCGVIAWIFFYMENRLHIVFFEMSTSSHSSLDKRLSPSFRSRFDSNLRVIGQCLLLNHCDPQFTPFLDHLSAVASTVPRTIATACRRCSCAFPQLIGYVDLTLLGTELNWGSRVAGSSRAQRTSFISSQTLRASTNVDLEKHHCLGKWGALDDVIC